MAGPLHAAAGLAVDRATAARGRARPSSGRWRRPPRSACTWCATATTCGCSPTPERTSRVPTAALDGGSSDVEGALLDALAVIELSSNDSLRDASAALRRGGGDGLLVAVLGSLDLEETRLLARLRHGSTAAIAVVLETASWNLVPTRSRQHRRRRRGLDRPAAGLRVAGAAGPARRRAARPVERRRSARRGQRPDDGRRRVGADHALGSLRMPLAAAFATVTAALCLGPIFLTGVLVLPDGVRHPRRRRRLRGRPADVRLTGHRAARRAGGAAALPAGALRATTRPGSVWCPRPARSTSSATLAVGRQGRHQPVRDADRRLPRHRVPDGRRRRPGRAGRRHARGDLAPRRAGRAAAARALHRADRPGPRWRELGGVRGGRHRVPHPAAHRVAGAGQPLGPPDALLRRSGTTGSHRSRPPRSARSAVGSAPPRSASRWSCRPCCRTCRRARSASAAAASAPAAAAAAGRSRWSTRSWTSGPTCGRARTPR